MGIGTDGKTGQARWADLSAHYEFGRAGWRTQPVNPLWLALPPQRANGGAGQVGLLAHHTFIYFF